MPAKSEYDAFVSYSRSDIDEVQHLVNSLRIDHGVKLWVDDDIEYGETWRDTVKGAIASSSGALVAIRKEPSGEQKVEIDLLLNKAHSSNDFTVWPVFLPGADGDVVDQLLANDPLGRFQALDLRDGLTNRAKLGALAESMRQERIIPLFSKSRRVTPYPEYDLPGGYRADVGRITSLLIGNSLYSSRDVAVRELIQNAFDACRRRRDSGIDYRPRIRVSINSDQGWFEVSDTGEGMGPEDIESSFATIGKSISQERHILERMTRGGEDRLFLIARFGIGFMSSFILSARIDVSTLRDGYSQINFSISDFTEPFEYTSSSLVDRDPSLVGTTIRLHLKPEFMSGGERSINLVEAVRKYCRHVRELDLQVDGQALALGDDWNLDAASRFSHRTEDLFYESKFCFPQQGASGIIVSNSGFYVETDPKVLLPTYTPSIVSGEVNFFPGMIDVNVARDKVVRSEMSDRIASEIAEDLKGIFKIHHQEVEARYMADLSGADSGESPSAGTSGAAFSTGAARDAMPFAMAFSCMDGTAWQDSPARDSPLLTPIEASEFVLDTWVVPIPGVGNRRLREAVQHVIGRGVPRIYGMAYSAYASEAGRLLAGNLRSTGDLVVETSSHRCTWSSGKATEVDESDVLRLICQRFGISYSDITQPSDEELLRIIAPQSSVPPRLRSTVELVEQRHKIEIKFASTVGPACFSYRGVNYVNLRNDEVAHYVDRLESVVEEVLFTYICGLVQRSPMRYLA